MPRLRALRFFAVNDAVARQVRGFSSGVFYAEGEEFTVSEQTWKDVEVMYPGYFERFPEPPVPEREKYDPTKKGAMTLSQFIEVLKERLEQNGDLSVFYEDECGNVPVKSVDITLESELLVSPYIIIS